MRRDEVVAGKMMDVLRGAIRKRMRAGDDPDALASLQVNAVGICVAEIVRFAREVDQDSHIPLSRSFAEDVAEGIRLHLDHAMKHPAAARSN